MRPLVVLGMHRSGTSAMTRCFNLMGWQLPKSVMPAGFGNEAGHWEAAEAVALNEAILQRLQRLWLDPKPLVFGPAETAATAAFDSRAVAVLDSELEGRPRFVVKDPRFSRLMPFWRRAFAACQLEPAAIIACRHPADVVRSLEHRDGIDLRHGLMLWVSYMLEAEAGTRGMRRAILHYEDFMDDWARCLDSIGGEVGVPPVADRETRTRIAAFLDPSLQHHRAARQASSDLSACSEAAEIHERLLQPGALDDQVWFDDVRRRWLAKWVRLSPAGGPSDFALQRPEFYIAEAVALENEGRVAESKAMLHQAAERNPRDTRLQHEIGVRFFNLADNQSAEIYLRRAAELAPQDVTCVLGLATVLHRLDRLPEALKLTQKTARLRPDDASVHLRIGHLQFGMGNIAGAAAAFREAVRLGPQLPVAHAALARTLARLGQIPEALAEAARAAELSPADESLASLVTALKARLKGSTLP